MSGWVLLDIATGREVHFEKFSDCFPGSDSPLEVKVGDKYLEGELRSDAERGTNL